MPVGMLGISGVDDHQRRRSGEHVADLDSRVPYSADFVAAQQIRTVRRSDDGEVRRYLLAGLILCGLCGRRMDAHWVNDRAGYRCRHGYNSARGAIPDRPRNLYVREDTLIAELDQHALVDGDDRSHGSLDAAAYLRSRDMMVVHDRAGWSLVACDEL